MAVCVHALLENGHAPRFATHEKHPSHRLRVELHVQHFPGDRRGVRTFFPEVGQEIQFAEDLANLPAQGEVFAALNRPVEDWDNWRPGVKLIYPATAQVGCGQSI